jgi:APA family basic amino acid/polyamine antiporter
LGKGQNPWRGVLFVGIISILIAAFAPLTIAIAVSSFGILLYYSITNLSALKLPIKQRMFPAWLTVAGLIGCLGLAFALAPQEIGIGLAILFIGIIFRAFRLAALKRKKSNPL